MKACLLYPEKDFINTQSYFDWSSISGDLGLETLFEAASRDVIKKNGRVMYLQREDDFLSDTLQKVMRVPVKTKEEVEYRQAILKDCMSQEAFVEELYDLTGDVLEKWDKLGRKDLSATGTKDTVVGLMTEIQIMDLFVDSLSELKTLLLENIEKLHSKGFQDLYQRLCEEYPETLEENLHKILKDLEFFTDTSQELQERNTYIMKRPKIAMDCGFGDGLKLSDIKLEEFGTQVKKYANSFGVLAKLQGYVSNLTPDQIPLQNKTELVEDASKLEFQIVSYVVACCSPFRSSFSQFFDQLHLQIGFYRAAINVKHHMERFDLDFCMPMVGERDSLAFDDLKEVVMSMEQKGKTVGNTCNMNGKMLMIVTGANQGGKSTFLRSIGIAQVMMQCGLFVPAKRYKSGIYPDFFTHFTRREDSAMNSGRLDEELRRMDQIIKHLGESPMLLLNESFATTTEKEGSNIAYDIIKALSEEDVKILTVTHLLSFAQKVFDETQENGNEKVEFLSAERLEDGSRTFKMIQHAPELTSFGLDLYDKIVEQRKKE